MKKETGGVSELEGALLGEIGRAGETTAYAARKAFALSPSTALSASKGAIYPAIARLVAAGLVAAKAVPGDARGAQTLRLTAKGARALAGWVGDADAAAGAGLDPFRMRAAHWARLPAKERAGLYRRLKGAIEARAAMLRQRLNSAPDDPDAAAIALDIRLQETRLEFLAATTGAPLRSR